MLARTLTDIANTHATDKGTKGPSAQRGANNYTDVYEGYFSPYRALPVTILEIGLGVIGERWEAHIVHGRNQGGGASLKTWYDYFEKARIFGIDVHAASYLDNDRISTFVVDQGNPAQLEAFVEKSGAGSFDIILDDGSHRPDHQQSSLGVLFKFLRPGGVYIIEDLMANGKGDGRKGRTANDAVLNTRSVLKLFKELERFAEPNALGDAEYLRTHTESIAFHSPRSMPYSLSRALAAKALRRPYNRMQFIPDSERVCVLRKKR